MKSSTHHSATDDGELDRIRGRVATFEGLVEQAQHHQFAGDPSEVAAAFLQDDPILAWRLLDLFDTYRSGSVYPRERLPGVIDRAVDTKLQLYYVARVLPGTENALVYQGGFDPTNPLATPNLQLARLCYAQGMIGQSRVLWDRLMRLVHFLEEGRDPEGKSTRRVFFRDLPRWSPRWDVLREWEADIDRYDVAYRTPEYHQGSILKKELLGGDANDPNRLASLLTPMMNGLWAVLVTNVQGNPHHILSLGRRIDRVATESQAKHPEPYSE
jgi:hypothetical protein